MQFSDIPKDTRTTDEETQRTHDMEVGKWCLLQPEPKYEPGAPARTLTIEGVLTRCLDARTIDGELIRFWRSKSGWRAKGHGWLHEHPLADVASVREAFSWRSSDYWCHEHGGLDMPPGWSFVPTGNRSLSIRIKRGPHAEVWGERRNYPKRLGYIAPSEFIEVAREKEVAARSKRNRKSEGSRTREQIKALKKLNFDDLFAKALASMAALNRRAKHLRSGRSTKAGDRRAIYEVKDRFLRAVVEAGRADRVLTWTIERPGLEVECKDCGHVWWGNGPECFACGGWGEAVAQVERWYLVEVGDYAWHTPHSSSVLHQVAVPHPDGGHDPDQPTREIPKVGLTIEAQMTCVELANERLGMVEPSNVVPFPGPIRVTGSG